VVCFLVQWRGARAAVCLGPLGYFFTRLVNVGSSGVWFFSVKKKQYKHCRVEWWQVCKWITGRSYNSTYMCEVVSTAGVSLLPFSACRCVLKFALYCES
jgi:hypothetical protein